MVKPPLSSRTLSERDRSLGLSALTVFGRALVGAIERHDVVQRVADALRTALNPDRLIIVLDDGSDKTVAFVHGVDTAQADDPLIALAQSRGPTLLSTDVAGHLAVLDVTVEEPPASWIGAPLAAAGPHGAVSLGSDTPGRFTERELDIVTGVTTVATIALENARLLAQLSLGKREWEQTVDAIGQAICVIDEHGAVRRTNRAFGRLVDESVTDIPGRSWMTLLPPTWAEPVGSLLADLSGARTTELRAGNRLFELTLLPLGETADGAVLIFDDHTERHRLQDQLIQSEKMSAIGQLIAGVAHDLNNPLASVMGFADYLVEGGKAPAELIEPLRAIQQEAERAANIVKNLLTFARKQDHKRRVIPVQQLLSSTLLLLNNQLLASRVDARLDIAPDLPDIDADPNQMQQVFVNLINNAAQAIESSGEGGHIQIRAVPWLDGVAVTVEDDGPGVPADVADRIFEPFFTTKPKGEGTGLGLSICQGIVKEHGGRLTLVQDIREGAAFRVELPAGLTAAPEAAEAPSETAALRILVVDDEPHIQHYMRATLEEWGHRVAVASNGAEALEVVRRESFDVIISDLRMPELGGRELFAELQRELPAVAGHLVFSTGDTVSGNTLAFLEDLGRPYLRKPFSLAELRAALAAAAGGF